VLGGKYHSKSHQLAASITVGAGHIPTPDFPNQSIHALSSNSPTAGWMRLQSNQPLTHLRVVGREEYLLAIERRGKTALILAANSLLAEEREARFAEQVVERIDLTRAVSIGMSLRVRLTHRGIGLVSDCAKIPYRNCVRPICQNRPIYLGFRGFSDRGVKTNFSTLNQRVPGSSPGWRIQKPL
jgi:hypothetical protein